MAFTSLHKLPFSEHSSLYFANDRLPAADHNNAFCKVTELVDIVDNK